VSKPTFYSIVLLLLVVELATAQQKEREVVGQSIQWFSTTSNIKLTRRVSLLVEGQFRQARKFEPQQYQARTGLEIKLNDHFSIMPVAYVYTWNFKYGKQPAQYQNHEHRLWQQVTYKHSFSPVSFEHRLRPEQRFIQHHSKMPSGEVVNEGYSVNQFRLRYRLMARVPLNNTSIMAKTLFASAYDEVFMSWGERVTYHEPDQNRVYVGFGYQFDAAFNLQAGFLYQMLVKSNGAMQENNLGLLVQMTYNVDWSGTN
jgi:hypothetical protein